MLSFFWIGFWLGLTVAMFAAGLRIRSRMRERIGSPNTCLTDEHVRQIIEGGSLYATHEEPLDLKEIDEEEERFWSESWEEPEEW